MQIFQWDERFKTGLSQIDDQHFHLVKLVNRVARLAADSHTSEQDLQDVFNQLAEYAHSHFADEERLMDRLSIDPRHTQMHRAQHADFIKQVTLMWEHRNIAENQMTILHGFLSAWLAAHILGIDHALSRMATDVHAGHSPGDAWQKESARHADNHESILLDALKQLYAIVTKQNQQLSEANQKLILAMKELEASAHLDTLTGLPNRALFLDRMNQALAQAKRHEQKVTLFFIDIDRFKPVNDRYGHAVGDALLKEVVTRIQTCIRQSDTIGRWGGDEFLILLPEADCNEAPLVVADKLQVILGDTPLMIGNCPCDVGISLGMAVYPTDGISPESLISIADQRMYIQKQSHQR